MADLDDLCAARARLRGDPLAGTALHVRRFLLVEHHGPWPFHALTAEGLDPEVVAALVERTRAVGGRTLLVRRPGRRSQQRRQHRWAVADVEAGRIRWGTWTTPQDLLAAREALAEPSDDWDDEPVVLVCAHGRHDTCCAVRGRPVAAALAASLGDRVWECSHVGGDRFAANVVVVPDGTYYGGLDVRDAVDVVAGHLEGRVDVDHLRGTSTLPPVAQAVAVAAHERWGPAGPRDVLGARVEVLETDARWRVELTSRGPLPERLVATVGVEHREAAVLTCQAAQATSARTFVVEDLRPA
ncbi:MAG: hypothetical protein PGN07_02010 [Aeromicrobium erythreum]